MSYPIDENIPCELILWFFYTLYTYISILLSIIPLYFTPKQTYYAWRRFALIALPPIALAIYSAPEYVQAPLVFGINREESTLLFSALFLTASWLLIVWKTVRGKK